MNCFFTCVVFIFSCRCPFPIVSMSFSYRIPLSASFYVPLYFPWFPCGDMAYFDVLKRRYDPIYNNNKTFDHRWLYQLGVYYISCILIKVLDEFNRRNCFTSRRNFSNNLAICVINHTSMQTLVQFFQ